MKPCPHLMICGECDAVYRRRSLAPGEVAHCTECHATLRNESNLNIDRWLALTVAAAIVYTIANTCPVIRVTLRGNSSETTLWQATVALAHSAAAPVAVPVALSVIAIPILQIALLGWILIHARFDHRAPGFAAAARLLSALRPWSMVEVALLGVLVAAIKLSGYLSVIPGTGAWAMAALMVLLIPITHRDTESLWNQFRGGR